MSRHPIRPFFCGNWKLFGTLAESVALATGVRDGVAGVTGAEVAVAPGFVALAPVVEKLRGGPVGVSAQNCHWETKGAFTGEVSRRPSWPTPAASYVIVGHSERRQLFGETDAGVAKQDPRRRWPPACRPSSASARPWPSATAARRWRVVGAPAGGAPCWSWPRGRAASLRHRLRAGVGHRHRPQRHPGAGGRGAPLHPRPLAERLGGPRPKGVRILYGGSVKPDNVAGPHGRARHRRRPGGRRVADG